MSPATEISNRDLINVRLRFLDLLKSFFQDEPDAERMSRWRGIFAALCRERINTQLDTAIRQLADILRKKELQELKNEHYELFVDPYSEFLLPLNAANYLDGKSFGPSLVNFRELLKQAQLVKIEGFTDSEDTILVMLDTLISMIEEEKQGSESAPALQKNLLQNFLSPFVNRLEERVKTNKKADFYKNCIVFLKEYIELEHNLIVNN